MSDLHIGRLIESLGDAFVADMLGLTSEQIVELLEIVDLPELASLAELSSSQRVAAEWMSGLARRIEQDPNESLSFRIGDLADDLCTWVPDHEGSHVAAVRAALGLERPAIRTTDPVAAPLSEIARDIAPVFTLWEPTFGGLAETGIEPGAGRHGVGGVHAEAHPAFERAMVALAADDQLRKLIGVKPRSIADFASYKLRYLGSTLFVALPLPSDGTLVVELVHGAYDAVRLRGGQGAEALLDELPRFLDRLRAGLAGEPYATSVLVGLGNLLLPDHASVTTPWGVVRDPRPSDRDFVTEGSTARAVLEFELATTLVVEDEGFDSLDGTLATEVAERARMIGLAALLAQQDGLPVGVYRSWCAVPRPIGTSDFDWPPSWADTPWKVDGPAKLDAFRRAAELAHAVHRRDADIAITRCLRALAERNDPTDALIDAVMVWENLFGATGELAFRISSGIARLLGADAAERRRLAKEVKVLYDVRSNVVHGKGVPAKRSVAQDSRRAVELAVQAIRSLYLERPELLALDAPERVSELLLL